MINDIPEDISKFFGYENTDLLGNLIYAAILVFRSVVKENDDLIKKVLKLSGIDNHDNDDRNMIDFMQLLEKIYDDIVEQKDTNILQQEMRHAPKSIRDSILSWPYYGLYWYWPKDIKFKDIKEPIIPVNLAKILLQFHFDVLNDKRKLLKENKKRSNDFYANVARGVTRGVELLSGIYIKKDTISDQKNKKYIENLYFDESNDDWLFNLYDIFENNSIEANSFEIKLDQKNLSFISYKNISDNIGEWHFKTSRKIKTGKSREKGSNKNLQYYMLQHYENYLKMKNSSYKNRTSNTSRKNISKIIPQFTVVEPFDQNLSINIDIPKRPREIEEIIEQQNFEIKRSRCFPEPMSEESTIPNVAKQRKINRAFSAQITKRSLLLKTDYEVPPKEHLKAFVKQVFNNKIRDVFNKEDFFKSIFLTSLITGYDYNRIVTAIFLQKNNMIEYKDKTNEIVIGIDPKLFSKEKESDFLIKSTKDIIYKLPHLYGMLWSKQKNNLSSLDKKEMEQLMSLEWEDEYIKFMKSEIKKFPKKIKINFKQIWRIIATYRREQSIEDMSILFCVGKYQTCDRSRLAYTATLRESDSSSEMMKKMYIDLDLHESICKFLDISSELFKPSLFNKKLKYTGSSRVLDTQESIKFFTKINKLIQTKDDPIIKFNLFSIAFRFALSITLGTRTFSNSDSFKYMAMHTIKISEKAETISTGIRIIPVCDITEQLINRYRQMAFEFGFEVTQTMLINDEGEFKPFNLATVFNILNNIDDNVEYIINFVTHVPLNTGRHIITKHAIETNFNSFYLEALLGHYINGGEHEGIFSTTNMKEYISLTRNMLQNIAHKYGVDLL
jgi:hypothetical protein